MTSTDPLAETSSPSISFKDQPIGTSYTMQVIGTPELVQSRDFKTREPATWPDGNPKMSLVINGLLDGQPRSLWAPKPSAMWAALVAARQEAGVPLEDGALLTVTFSGTKAKAGMDPQKLYTAVYVPKKADALAEAPPF